MRSDVDEDTSADKISIAPTPKIFQVSRDAARLATKNTLVITLHLHRADRQQSCEIF